MWIGLLNFSTGTGTWTWIGLQISQLFKSYLLEISQVWNFWIHNKSDEEKSDLKRSRRSNYNDCQPSQQQLTPIIDSIEHGFCCHNRTSSYTTRLYQNRSPRGGVLRKRGLRKSLRLRAPVNKKVQAKCIIYYQLFIDIERENTLRVLDWVSFISYLLRLTCITNIISNFCISFSLLGMMEGP